MSPEEQAEFDQHYGEEDDLLYEDDEEFMGESLTTEEMQQQEQIEYYMQQHPELLLALDIAAYRRQQVQNRLHENRAVPQPPPLIPEVDLAQEDPSDTDEQRDNIYEEIRGSIANSTIAQALSLSPGIPNVGGYSYQSARGNLLSHLQSQEEDENDDQDDLLRDDDNEEDD